MPFILFKMKKLFLMTQKLQFNIYNVPCSSQKKLTTITTCFSLQIFIKIIHNAINIFYVTIKYNDWDE